MIELASKYKRAILAGILTVILGGWCILASGADNHRFVETLHRSHQGERFDVSLSRANAGLAPGERLDECSVCHPRRGWVPDMVSLRAPVQDFACKRCHPQAKEMPAAKLGSPLGGEFFKEARWARPPHRGDFSKLEEKRKEDRLTVAGLTRSTTDPHHILPLRCGDCHPDHEGSESVQRVPVKLEGDKQEHRVVVQDLCMGCHVPAASVSEEARIVLRRFVVKHRKYDAHYDSENEAEKTAARAKYDVGDSEKPNLDPGNLERAKSAVMTSLSALPDPAFRTCTPFCHAEHKEDKDPQE